MNTFVTALCSSRDTSWLAQMRDLARIAGVNLPVRFLDPEATTALDPGSCTQSPGSCTQSPGSCTQALPDSPALGSEREIVLCAATVAHLAPSGSIPVALQGQDVSRLGDRRAQVLWLPLDQEQILALLSPKSRCGYVLGVQGVVPPVNTTVVAAILAQMLHLALPDLPQCLVDFSGSMLPLTQYLYPIQDGQLSWEDLGETGQYPASRLAAEMPQWQGISLLSASGLCRGTLPGRLAVLEALQTEFPVMVLDLGSGALTSLTPVDGLVLVGEGNWASCLAAQSLLEGLRGSALRQRVFFLSLEGAISSQQILEMLSRLCPDLPASSWKIPRKYRQMFHTFGLEAPLPANLQRLAEPLSTQILSGIRRFTPIA